MLKSDFEALANSPRTHVKVDCKALLAATAGVDSPECKSLNAGAKDATYDHVIVTPATLKAALPTMKFAAPTLIANAPVAPPSGATPVPAAAQVPTPTVAAEPTTVGSDASSVTSDAMDPAE